MLAKMAVSNSTAAIGQSILRVESYSLVIVLNGTLMSAKVAIGEATVVLGQGILSVEEILTTIVAPNTYSHSN